MLLPVYKKHKPGFYVELKGIIYNDNLLNEAKFRFEPAATWWSQTKSSRNPSSLSSIFIFQLADPLTLTLGITLHE